MGKPRRATPPPIVAIPRDKTDWMVLLKPLTKKTCIGQSFLLPVSYASRGAANTAAWRINKGGVKLPPGQWEATASNKKLYVTYLGE